MKIQSLRIHNYKSIVDQSFDWTDYCMLVGPNNVGKSTVINALRMFYEQIKFSEGDMPKVGRTDEFSFMDVTFILTDTEYAELAEKYKGSTKNVLQLRKYFKHPKKCSSKQSNLYQIQDDGTESDDLFYGWKSVGQDKLGRLIYIPALSVPSDHLKTSGASPFRDAVNQLFQDIIEKNAAYAAIKKSFDDLTAEANGEKGFLQRLISPINVSLDSWKIKMEVTFDPISPENIVKNHIRPLFKDDACQHAGGLDEFGNGYQRSVIYQLIRLSSSLEEKKVEAGDKKEFNPQLTLILFEEPEAFLHPEQQVNLAISLRHYGSLEAQQVLLTTHSPLFLGRSASDLSSIVRLHKTDGKTTFCQIKKSQLAELASDNDRLYQKANAFAKDTSKPQNQRDSAQRMVDRANQNEDVRLQEESFRYQVWLDSERSAAFFSDIVLIVEGSTEQAMFNYLSENDWKELREKQVYTLNALGKYNIHRYMTLLECMGINFVVFADTDTSIECQIADEIIKEMSAGATCCINDPYFLPSNIEAYFGLAKMPADKKPIQMISALASGKLDAKKLSALKADVLNLITPAQKPDAAKKLAA